MAGRGCIRGGGGANYVCRDDFASPMAHDERGLRMLVQISEYTLERLAIRVARRLSGTKTRAVHGPHSL